MLIALFDVLTVYVSQLGLWLSFVWESIGVHVKIIIYNIVRK